MLEMKTNCGSLGSKMMGPNAMIQELREEFKMLSSKINMLKFSYYTIRTCIFCVFLFCLVIILAFSIVLVKV